MYANFIIRTNIARDAKKLIRWKIIREILLHSLDS